ncbi:hypothetical protein CRE_02379 [Caenorhabditis remanei]|uniref:Uncharacterized protein n=1 Tax=Caenorhabditis remanei TaxID=31234 RepID=E3MII6_CAERE|nr:hypothetical protein CRE_02379 [Caenorhabditis remanei]
MAEVVPECISFAWAYKPRRVIMPILRKRHFALAVFSRESQDGSVQVHVMDSEMDHNYVMITPEEAFQFSSFYFEGVKTSDVKLEKGSKKFRSKVIYMLCKKENEYTYYKDIWKVMLKVCSMLEIAMQHFENNKILVWIREIKVAAVLDRNTDVFSFAHWMGDSKTKHYNMEFILKSIKSWRS